MRYFLFIYSLLVLAWSAKAQQEALRSALCLSSPDLAHKVYRVYAPMDLLSMADSLYIQRSAAKDTVLCLDLHMSSITQMRMVVGRQNVTWYAVPGKTYQWQLLNLYNGKGAPRPLQIRFVTADVFNMAIEGFNYVYQDFIERSFVDLVRYRDQSVYAAFEKKVLQQLAETPLVDSVESDFFNNFVQYRLAKLRLTGRIDSKQTLIKRFFISRPVLYHNLAYMELFKAVFDPNSINSLGVEHHAPHIIDVLRQEKGFEATYSFVERQIGAQEVSDAALTDMVFLYTIKGLYTNKALRKSYLRYLLQQFIINSNNVNSQTIARHLLRSLDRYEPGRLMPQWKEEWEIQSDNKLNYVLFCNSQRMNVSDLKVMDSLSQVAQNLRFIAVFIDEWSVQNNMQHIAKRFPHIEWRWFDNKYQLLNDLGVMATPAYYLIDHKNRLISASAPCPQQTNDIKRLLTQYLKRN